MSVLVVIEHRAGKLIRISSEALSAGLQVGKATGSPVIGVTLGSKAENAAAEVSDRGVSKLLALDHSLLAEYTPEGYVSALEQLIRSQQPDVVVFPHTYQVRDYAPKLAARLGKPLVSDVVEIKGDEGGPAFVRQLFGGKLSTDVRVQGKPQLVSVQAGAFRAAEPGGEHCPVEKFDVQIEPSQIRSKPEPPYQEVGRSVDLGAADMIVSVGRGIKEKENLSIVEDLAHALGAELAASRPVCDNGWLPMERQVGSSGQTVAPKVYFAVGISGAIQHLVGMKGSKTVVAINKDESAPIFETADYGVVADLFEVVPAIVEEIKKTKA